MTRRRNGIVVGAAVRRRRQTGGGGGDPTYDTTVLWSALNPLPIAGDNVVIPADTHVILDVVTPALGHLTIAGKLSAKMDVAVLGVTAASAELPDTGVWQIGNSLSDPYLGAYTITLNGAKPASGNAGVARGINVMGGKLLWYGNATRKHRARLAADAAAGATALTITEAASGWKNGDDIAICPTDYFQKSGRTQRVALAADATGAGLTLAAGLAFAKFGRLQYVNDSGLSFTDGTFTPRPEWPVDMVIPRVLDERAMVANLTRNIVVQAPDDTDWQTSGFGAHVMVMGLAQDVTERIQVSGVRFRRCGQRGLLGRYPFHWHMLSYSSYDPGDPVNSGKEYYGPVVGHYIRDCVVEDSANRGIVIHGTNGVEVRRNVLVSVRGHGYFLENGVERRNQLHDNVVMLVNDPHPGVLPTSLQFNPDGSAAGGVRLAAHEADLRVAGFWITNPDNDITGNWTADINGNGMWFSFAEKPFGPSRNALLQGTTARMNMRYMRHGAIYDNAVQSCYRFGALTEQPVIDEAGNVQASGGYQPQLADQNGTGVSTYTIRRLSIYKCGQTNGTTTGAYNNRSFPINYEELLIADCAMLGIHGSAEGRIDRTTMVGRTLNTPTTQNANRTGVQTYHFSVAQVNCMFVNFPFAVGTSATDRDPGASAQHLIDLYLDAYEPGTMMTVGSKFINAHPGYRCKPPWMKGRIENFTFAGAVLDPWGYWGAAGTYMVYGNYAPQNAFFTHGLTDAVAHEPAATSGTVATFRRYFGVGNFRTEQNPTEYQPRMPLHVFRQDSTGVTVGEWFVEDGRSGGTLPQMRHFAVANGGRYRVTYPYEDATPQAPSSFHQFSIEGAWRTDDAVVLGMPWAGATAKVYAQTKNDIPKVSGVPVTDSVALAAGQARVANVAAASIAEVADPVGNANGLKVYVDTVNKICWFRHVGGLVYPGEANFPSVPFPTGYTAAYMEQFKRPYNYAIIPA